MERTILACDADIRFERARETQMAHARRHDVRHHLRTGQRFEHGLRRVAETEHAVAAGVVHDGTLQRNHPRAARGQRDVRIHRVFRIEVDEVRLHARELFGFVEREQFRNSLRNCACNSRRRRSLRRFPDISFRDVRRRRRAIPSCGRDRRDGAVLRVWRRATWRSPKAAHRQAGAATQTSSSLQFYHEGGMAAGPPEPVLHGANSGLRAG